MPTTTDKELPGHFSPEEYEQLIDSFTNQGDHATAEELLYRINQMSKTIRFVPTIIALDGKRKGGIVIGKLTLFSFNLISDAMIMIGEIFNKKSRVVDGASLPHCNPIANLNDDPFLKEHDQEEFVKSFVERVIQALNRSLKFRKKSFLRFDAPKYLLLVIHRFKDSNRNPNQQITITIVHQITIAKNCTSYYAV